jgi:hypothetical protein
MDRKRFIRALTGGVIIMGAAVCQRRSSLSPERRFKMSAFRRI